VVIVDVRSFAKNVYVKVDAGESNVILCRQVQYFPSHSMGWLSLAGLNKNHHWTLLLGHTLTLIRMTKDEKGLAFFKGLLL
jgi:hypothetical protein